MTIKQDLLPPKGPSFSDLTQPKSSQEYRQEVSLRRFLLVCLLTGSFGLGTSEQPEPATARAGDVKLALT